MEKLHPFTANIRALAAAAVNQTEFAERVGATQGTVSRWKNGTIPRMEMVAQIADKLGLSVSDLMEGSVSDVRQPSVAEAASAIMLPVLLPNEETLTRMFETSLEKLVAADQLDEIARTLAQRLPVDLQHALSPVPARVRGAALSRGAGVQDDAKRQQPDQPESRI